MPNPKRRRSKSRQAKRRIKCLLTAKGLSTCPNCGRKEQPHRICPYCGFYKGKQVIVIKQKKKEKK